MATKLAGTLFGSVMLMACDGGSTPAKSEPAALSDGGYKAKIDALAEPQRNALFLRAVRDAGQDCQGVAGSAYQGIQQNMPSWVARCSDGRDWLVMVGSNGQALVARREEAPAAAK